MRVHLEGTRNAVVLEDENAFLSFSPSPAGGVDTRFFPPGKDVPPFSPTESHEVLGCIGVLEWANDTWILCAAGHPFPYGAPAGKDVCNIPDVLFFPLSSSHAPDASHHFHPCHHLHKLFYAGTFYYSRDTDLSTRLYNQVKVKGQRHEACVPQARAEQNPPLVPPPHAEGTEEFAWNSFLLEPLKKLREALQTEEQAAFDSRAFAMPLIHGFYHAQAVEGTDGGRMVLEIISRCGWRRAGVQDLTEGIDEGGNVAMFVETETILSTPTKSCSFVQLRGDVPLIYHRYRRLLARWIHIDRPLEQHALPPFIRHFRQLTAAYSAPVRILSLNAHPAPQATACFRLLHFAKSQDLVLKKEVKWLSFGIENVIAGGGLVEQTAWEGYDEVEPGTEGMGITVVAVDGQTRRPTLEQEQQGVWRLDSSMHIDITSVAAWRISAAALNLALFAVYGNCSPSLAGSSLEKVHNRMFAANTDRLSEIYTGTRAWSSPFIRTARASVAHIGLRQFLEWPERKLKEVVHGKETQRAIQAVTGQLAEQKKVELHMV
ncbi:hypothetical protein JCM10213_001499 [Rhodosporidiobolus nylandii]